MRFRGLDQFSELYMTAWGWAGGEFLTVVFWDGSWDQLRRDVP